MVILCLLSALNTAICQETLVYHFAVDMNQVISCGLLSPVNGDLVIIRGSFSGWSGNDFMLNDDDQDGIYRGTFNIRSDSGTLAEYKYLILKPDGSSLWEKYPETGNEPHGNRYLIPSDTSLAEFNMDRYHLCLVGKEVFFTAEELKEDFTEFRNTLEKEHCCLYEYTTKNEFESLFDEQYHMVSKSMTPTEFFKILTPITARIGCGHTALWMPDGFWSCGRNNLFPLQFRFLEDKTVVAGCYGDSTGIEKGSILLEINDVPISDLIYEIQANYSADAMNHHFIRKQIERRFSLIYARRFGFRGKFRVKYLSPGSEESEIAELTPASLDAVRAVVFETFRHPPLTMEIIDTSTALMKIPTFIYYDRVPWFTNFIDSCFALIHDKNIPNLILDLRGNHGGDPFCAAPLLSYLLHEPQPYFSQPNGKYAELAYPLPLPENHFTGNLFTLIDGHCFSTNGHFCSLLKYHQIGKLVGSPTGATYMCNAGKNRIKTLKNSEIMLYFGRSTYATAVKDMDKTQPIFPDYPVEQTLVDFLADRDTVLEYALNLIHQ